jgi:Mrp family chromosome partitioning ATPase
VENGVGLSNVLLGEVPVDEAVQAVSPNLWLLVTGRIPARPAELLQSHRMSELLAQMRDRFDFVLIDCPPVLGLADSLSIAPLADAVLLVASAGATKRGAIVHAIDQLGQVGASVVGGILNNVTFSKRGGSYGYGYGYGYGYDEAPEDEETVSRFDRVRGRTSAANGNGSARTKDPERPPQQGTEPGGDEVPVEPESRSEAIARRDS